MAQPAARPAVTAISTARRLSEGSTPGSPAQIGQTWLFGGAPNAVLQPQKSLDRVRSWQWTSMPMTVSNATGRLQNRSSSMPWGGLLIGIGCAQQRRFIKRLAEQLQADRQT